MMNLCDLCLFSNEKYMNDLPSVSVWLFIHDSYIYYNIHNITYISFHLFYLQQKPLYPNYTDAKITQYKRSKKAIMFRYTVMQTWVCIHFKSPHIIFISSCHSMILWRGEPPQTTFDREIMRHRLQKHALRYTDTHTYTQ